MTFLITSWKKFIGKDCFISRFICVVSSICLVLMLSVSFSIPSFAAVSTGSYEANFSYPVYSGLSYAFNGLPITNLNLKSDADDDSIYLVDWNISVVLNSSFSIRPESATLSVYYGANNIIPIGYASRAVENSFSNVNTYNFNLCNYFTGSQIKNLPIRFITNYLTNNTGTNNITVLLNYSVNNISVLSNSEADQYQNGYNAGYSDGLLDGEASVDTETIRNEAYQAGYEAGLAAGSDDTLKEDKTLLDTVTNEFTLTGQVINNYSQQYIVEPTLSIANGSLNYTMPVSLGYLFDVGKDYLVDIKRISVVNSNDKVDVELGEYVDHRISNSPTFSLSGPGLYMSSCGELIYSPNQTGDFNLRVSVPAELVLRSTYNEPIENDYAGVYVPSSGFALGKLNWDSTFTYEIDVYEIDIVEEIDYLRDQSNKLSDLNNTQQESLDTMKETQETTKGIFSSIQDFFGSFFQNLIDSVIGLFVPSAEEMSGLFDQLNQFFSDRFGFLYAPFDYMIQLLDVFISSSGDTGLTFPGFSIMGYEVWPDMTYDISEDPLVGQIFQYVRMGTGILLAGWFVMYLQDFFKERFSQG